MREKIYRNEEVKAGKKHSREAFPLLNIPS